VLADQAARVAPGAARLAAETGGQRGHADRQIVRRTPQLQGPALGE
jgi:hypothetical protein